MTVMAPRSDEEQKCLATGGQAMAQALVSAGVDRVFLVPGESFLPLIDAIDRDGVIDLVTCRHEGGAAFMAVADAKLTGRAGVIAVSRGPGVTNAAIGIHTAEQDGVPLVVIVGQVDRAGIGRGTFQEIDLRGMFGSVAKAVRPVLRGDELAASTLWAIDVAQSGLPGPVMLEVPEDVFDDVIAVSRPIAAPRPSCAAPIAPDDLDAVVRVLARAERPLLLAGAGLDNADGRRALRTFAHACAVPVVTTYRLQHLIDNDDPYYAGYLGLGVPAALPKAIAEADVIVTVGSRLEDITTQDFAVPAQVADGRYLATVHRAPGAATRIYRPNRTIVCDEIAFLDMVGARNPYRPPARAAWAQRLHAATRALREWRSPGHQGEDIVFGDVVAALDAIAAHDAIVALDAGNFSTWAHRLLRLGGERMLIGAISGAMGIGVPAGVAAALRYPGREVIVIVGDGGMLMTGTEMIALRSRKGRVRIIVSDNGAYGTIRSHQERRTGGAAATALDNPDFRAMADAFGIAGFTLGGQGEEHLDDVLRAAFAVDGPSLVHVRTNLEHISAFTTVTQLRAARSAV